MLELSHITHSFSDSEGSAVLKDVSLSVGPGELVALAGANGSGKTTLALVASGFIKPDSGKIALDGLELDFAKEDLSEKLYELHRRLGVVFQNPATQLVCSCVEDEIAFGLRNLGVPQDELEERIDEACVLTGLTSIRKRDLRELSGGQAQILVIACAIAMRPRYLILDEPCAMLDAEASNGVHDIVHKLCESGCGVLLITHDLDEIARCERVMVLDFGMAVYCGKPSGLIESDRLVEWGLAVEQAQPLNTVTKPAVSGEIETYSESLSFQDVDFAYAKVSGTVPVLSGCTIEFQAGKVTALLGKNGSGKSTMLKLMAGLLKPCSGRIEFVGGAPLLGSVAYQMQDPARQLFEQTVERDVAFALRCRKVEEGERGKIARDAIGRVGLEPKEYASRSPFSLSGGQARRASLAGVLVLGSGCLLLDEPTAGLDARGRARLRDILQELAFQGVCVVVATHDIDFVDDTCDYAVILEGGKCRHATCQVRYMT